MIGALGRKIARRLRPRPRGEAFAGVGTQANIVLTAEIRPGIGIVGPSSSPI